MQIHTGSVDQITQARRRFPREGCKWRCFLVRPEPRERYPRPRVPAAADKIRRLPYDNSLLREEVGQLRAAVDIYREVAVRVSREDRVA